MVTYHPCGSRRPRSTACSEGPSRSYLSTLRTIRPSGSCRPTACYVGYTGRIKKEKAPPIHFTVCLAMTGTSELASEVAEAWRPCCLRSGKVAATGSG